MRYVFVRAINSAFYSYGQWRNSCSYCRDNSTWSPRWTKQIFSLKSSPAEQAFPFFSFVCFQGTEMQRRERHEKQDTRSPHPCNLSLEKYKLTKKHYLRLITEFMSATRAANLLLSTHGSFTKKREAGTANSRLGSWGPLPFPAPVERERVRSESPKNENMGGRDIGNHPFDQPTVFAIGEKK